MNIADELEKLEHLRRQGTLNEFEFQQAKARVLHGDSPEQVSTEPGAAMPASGVHQNVTATQVYGIDTNTWCMLMHLSQLLNIAPGAGIVVPILMWVFSKDNNPAADRHGAAIVNWTITAAIVLAICMATVFLVIPIFIAMIVGVLAFIFPIIGAIKAANGDVWDYPCSIRFVSSQYDLVEEEDEEDYF